MSASSLIRDLQDAVRHAQRVSDVAVTMVLGFDGVTVLGTMRRTDRHLRDGRIVSWTEIETARINPMLPAIDAVVKELRAVKR